MVLFIPNEPDPGLRILAKEWAGKDGPQLIETSANCPVCGMSNGSCTGDEHGNAEEADRREAQRRAEEAAIRERDRLERLSADERAREQGAGPDGGWIAFE